MTAEVQGLNLKNLPPQAVEYEQSILAGMLIDAELCERSLEVLKPDHFYKTSHQLIFSAANNLFDAQKPVNLVTVAEALRAKGQLAKVGGASYLASLPDEVPVPSSVTHYAQVIREKYTLREVSKTANELLNGCFANDAKASALIETTKDALEAIREQGVDDQGKSLDSAFVKRISESLWDKIEHNMQSGKIGQETGFKFIDRSILGLVRTFFYIWGGYTSSGKTALMIQLIINVIKHNPEVRIAVFSTEMSSEHILARMIANVTGIPSLKIFQGNLGPGELEEVNNAISYFDSKKMWVFDNVYRFEGISEKCRAINDLDLVFVDYLQNMQGDGSIYERMSILPVQLQKMAKELNLSVVGLSQVSNEAARGDRGIIGYKGAGEIAAACDFGAWLERSEDDERILNCFVRKNRHGPTCKTTLRYSENFTRISEEE